MVILAPDASKMPQGDASAGLRPAPAKAAGANKIETIQSVLRHFLGEKSSRGLGKS
jgi:hypothetical protein